MKSPTEDWNSSWQWVKHKTLGDRGPELFGTFFFFFWGVYPCLATFSVLQSCFFAWFSGYHVLPSEKVVGFSRVLTGLWRSFGRSLKGL